MPPLRSHSVIATDAQYIVDNFRKGQGRQTTNQDLWQEVWEEMGPGMHGDVEIVKVAAHIADKPAAQGKQQLWQTFVNSAADALAVSAAASCAVSDGCAQRVGHADDLATRILKRLGTIEIHMAENWPREPAKWVPKPRRTVQEALAAAVGASGHRVHWSKDRVECLLCRQGSSRRTIRRWLNQGPCPGTRVIKHGKHIFNTPAAHEEARSEQEVEALHPDSSRRVVAMFDVTFDEDERIGGPAHPSHKLRDHRGLTWCDVCASYSAGRVWKGLRKQCAGAGNTRTLERLRAGKLPQNRTHWPDEQGSKPAPEREGARS